MRVDVPRERADGEPRDGDGVVGAGYQGPRQPGVFPEDGRGAARASTYVSSSTAAFEPLDRAALDPRAL